MDTEHRYYSTLSEEEKNLVHSTLTWIRLRMLHESRVRELMNEDLDEAIKLVTMAFSPDLDHSALFNRLINGEEALPVPPPRAYSYPWYSLIETGEARLGEHDVYGPVVNHWLAGQWFNICQSMWEIIDYDDGVYTLKYDDANPLFTLRPGTTYATTVRNGKPERIELPGWEMRKVEDDASI